MNGFEWEPYCRAGFLALSVRHTAEGLSLFLVGLMGQWRVVINPYGPDEVELGSRGATSRPPTQWADRLYDIALEEGLIQPAVQGCMTELCPEVF